MSGIGAGQTGYAAVVWDVRAVDSESADKSAPGRAGNASEGLTIGHISLDLAERQDRMAITKRTRILGITYPYEVEKAAVALLRAMEKHRDSGELRGDVFDVAHRVLIHMAHSLYIGGYPEPYGPPRVREPERRAMPKVVARKVWDRDDWTCQHCGTHRNLTVDHIVPITKGGADDMDNYQTLCGPCNSRKGNR